MSGRRSVLLALALWILLAFVVWNVIFDRMVVLAGRRYVHDAYELYHGTGRYLLIDDVMRPAVARAFRVASITAAAIVMVSVVAIRLAADRDRRRAKRPDRPQPQPVSRNRPLTRD